MFQTQRKSILFIQKEITKRWACNQSKTNIQSNLYNIHLDRIHIVGWCLNVRIYILQSLSLWLFNPKWYNYQIFTCETVEMFASIPYENILTCHYQRNEHFQCIYYFIVMCMECSVHRRASCVAESIEKKNSPFPSNGLQTGISLGQPNKKKKRNYYNVHQPKGLWAFCLCL